MPNFTHRQKQWSREMKDNSDLRAADEDDGGGHGDGAPSQSRRCLPGTTPHAQLIRSCSEGMNSAFLAAWQPPLSLTHRPTVFT